MKDRKEIFLSIKKQIESAPFAKNNITAERGDGIEYLKYRLLRPLYKLRYNRYQKAHPHEPWLCPDAITALRSLLKGGKGIEYGSGRSTLFFSQFLDELHSVEHHAGWSEKVQIMLNEAGLTNTQLHHIPAETALSDPKLSSEQQFFFTESQYPIKDTDFASYVNFLDQVADESIDFILVDGRARKSCALKAMPKLKKGGILVLDNSERRRYSSVHEAFKGFATIFTTTGLTDTTIWLKD